MLEPHPHHGRHGVQPRHTVIDHEDGESAGRQDAPALLDHAPGVVRVLQDAVRVGHVELRVVERERLAVAHPEVSLPRKPAQLQVQSCERDRLRGEVDTGHLRAAPCEANQVGANATTDLQESLVREPAEIDQRREIAQLVEPVVVEVIEKLQRTDRRVGHLQIVDTLVPIGGDGVKHEVTAPVGATGRAPSRAFLTLTASVQYRTVRRDLRALANSTFDLLVVGAGIYGATLAWDAAQRGLSVALVDQGDFGGGTSANSLKTVHGGVRALQSGSPTEMRLFVRERRALCRIAPHLVHPLPFVVPTYRGLTRHPLVMRTGFGLYDLVAHDRNDLPDRSKHLPPSRLVSRDECLALSPHIDPTGVTGGIVWHDCQMYSSDRVLLAFVQSAVQAGAVAGNYLDVTGWVRDGERVIGAHVEDRLGAGAFDVRASLVVNASGPGSRRLLEGLPAARSSGPPPGLSKAMNLVTRSITGDHAVGGMAGARFLFAAPWRQVSIVGTSHDPFDGPSDALTASDADVDRFLNDVNDAFPGAGLRRADVRLVHRGLLPSEDDAGHELLKGSRVRDHRADGVPGLMTVLGVRYTTARATAERATDLAFSILGRRAPPCETATTPLTGGAIPDWDAFLRAATGDDDRRGPLARDTAARLARTYGAEHRQVIQSLREAPALAAPLSDRCAVTRGELLHATRQEMAVHLSDAVLRRTEAGSDGHPGPAALQAAAQVMGDELGWSADDRAREIQDVEQVYPAQ